MAVLTRTSVFGLKKETTDGDLLFPSAPTDFSVLREGFTLQGSVESIETDELTGQREKSAPVLGKETPSGSIPKYLKGSGVEGQAPDYGVMIEACLGELETHATEYDTIAGSTAGTQAAAAVLKVGAGEGANFEEGQAVLIKDSTNGFKIRNVKSISTDDLTLNFNLNAAPALGVNLGKAVHYSPSVSNPPTFSAHLYQGKTGAAYANAIAGCRTTSIDINLPAGAPAEVTFAFEGTSFYFNPINVTADKTAFDFVDPAGTQVCYVTPDIYKTPVQLAAELQEKINGVSATDHTVNFSSTTGKFSIASAGATLELPFSTGAHAANTIGELIGFDISSDKTAATSYVSDNELDYSPSVTPTFDNADPIIVRSAELIFGDFFETQCRKALEASFSVAAEKQDVNAVCASSGVSESLSLVVEATFNATIQLEKHEVAMFDKFINNTTTSFMFNCGVKNNAGNWTAGKCVNIYMKNAKISGDVIAENNGVAVFEIEAKSFGTPTEKGFHINFV